MQQILGIINLALAINETEAQKMRRWFMGKRCALPLALPLRAGAGERDRLTL